jgi:hypothetical protein
VPLIHHAHFIILSCDNKKVATVVSCDLWNDKHALVSKAIAMFLQKPSEAWGIRNAYEHGTPVDVFESASERRGANGIIDARALMATYIYAHSIFYNTGGGQP